MMKKQYRVIQYVPYFPPHTGGLETHAAQRAKRWVQEGCGDCMVATYDVGQTTRELSYEQDGYQVICIPAFEIIPTFPFPTFWTRRYWQAHSVLRGYQADILTTRTRFFMSSFWGGMFARWHGIQRVHIEHGVDYVKMNARWKEWIAWIYDQTFGRFVFRMSDRVIGISQGCKRFAQRFTSKDIPVIYRGVEFVPAAKMKKQDDTIALGFVGRLAGLKGVDIILQAFAALKQTGRVCTLSLVGDGEERRALEVLTQELGLEEDVRFLGYKDKDYLENVFYPRMDICVNASWQEGLPTSVIEPLLSGCTVVATAVGGTPEITDKKDLILVAPGDVEELTLALEEALDQYSTLGGLSKEIVRETFDWSCNIQRYYNYFVSLEDGGR